MVRTSALQSAVASAAATLAVSERLDDLVVQRAVAHRAGTKKKRAAANARFAPAPEARIRRKSAPAAGKPVFVASAFFADAPRNSLPDGPRRRRNSAAALPARTPAQPALQPVRRHRAVLSKDSPRHLSSAPSAPTLTTSTSLHLLEDDLSPPMRRTQSSMAGFRPALVHDVKSGVQSAVAKNLTYDHGAAGTAAALLRERRKRQRGDVLERRLKLFEDERNGVLNKVQDREKRRSDSANHKILLTELCASRFAALLGTALSKHRLSLKRRKAGTRISKWLGKVYRHSSLKEQLRVMCVLARVIGGYLPFVVKTRIRRKHRAVRMIKYALRNLFAPYKKVVCCARRLRRAANIMNTCARGFLQCTRARKQVLRRFFDDAIRVEAGKESAEWQRAKLGAPRARTPGEEVDQRRAEKWRTIQAGLEHIKIRLKHADALVELSNSADFINRGSVAKASLELEMRVVSASRRDVLLSAYLLGRRLAAVAGWALDYRVPGARKFTTREARILVHGDGGTIEKEDVLPTIRVLPFFCDPDVRTLRREIHAIFIAERKRKEDLKLQKRDGRLRKAHLMT